MTDRIPDTELPTPTTIIDRARAALLAAGLPWAQHWIAGGYAGTGAIAAKLDLLDSRADRLIAVLVDLEREQRQSASAREHEWQRAVLEVAGRHGQLLSAATPDERRAVADKLAQAVQVLVCWGFEEET